MHRNVSRRWNESPARNQHTRSGMGAVVSTAVRGLCHRTGTGERDQSLKVFIAVKSGAVDVVMEGE